MKGNSGNSAVEGYFSIQLFLLKLSIAVVIGYAVIVGVSLLVGYIQKNQKKTHENT